MLPLWYRNALVKQKNYWLSLIYNQKRRFVKNEPKEKYLALAGVVVLIAAVVSAFVIMQPSAKDILIQTLETTKTINDAHAVVEVNVDSPEQKASATVEVWGRKSGRWSRSVSSGSSGYRHGKGCRHGDRQ